MSATDERSPHRPGRGPRRAGPLALAVVAAGLVGVGVALGPAIGQDRDESDTTETTATAPLPTEAVTRGDLVETTDEGGAVDYGPSWNIPIATQGVVTAAPDKGSIVDPGQPLIEVGGKPVHLAEGATPLYRILEYRSSSKDRLLGEDVAQLQRFLLDAGYDDAGRLEADGEFGRSTQRAVKAWQKANGLEQSGTVDRSQLVFNPGPVRVAAGPRIGADFDRLEVTEASQEVTARFDRDDRGFVPVGAEVTIEVDAETSLTGTITEVSAVTAEDGSRVLEVAIEPSAPLPAEVDRVNVGASRTRAEDVLIVPVRAVVALASGGYGLEVETPSGPELRRVELGAVVDDQVEVAGDLADGDDVLVPRTIGSDE